MSLLLASNSDDRKKRPRTAFSAAQIKALESEFERGKYLSVAKRTSLAKSLNLTETQVNLISTIQSDASLNVSNHPDQNLVSKPSHQVQAEIHFGRGDLGIALLLIARHRRTSSANGRWRSSLALQPASPRTSRSNPIFDAQQCSADASAHFSDSPDGAGENFRKYSGRASSESRIQHEPYFTIEFHEQANEIWAFQQTTVLAVSPAIRSIRFSFRQQNFPKVNWKSSRCESSKFEQSGESRESFRQQFQHSHWQHKISRCNQHRRRLEKLLGQWNRLWRYWELSIVKYFRILFAIALTWRLRIQMFFKRLNTF